MDHFSAVVTPPVEAPTSDNQTNQQLFTRTATTHDLSALVAHINQAFAAGNAHLTRDRQSTEEIAHLLQIGHFLLIEEKEKIIGSIYAEIRAEGRGYLGLLAVDPAKRRSGMWRQLIRAGEQFCKQQECRLVEGNAISLRPEVLVMYKRYGFRVVGEIPGVHRDRVNQDYTLILLERDL